MSKYWDIIKNIAAPIFQLISKNYGFILGALLTGIAIFAYIQWQEASNLRSEILIMEERSKQESQRLLNNVRVLNDSLRQIEESNTRYKRMVSVREGEIEYLNQRLINVKSQFQEEIKKVIDTVHHIENVFVGDIAINKDTVDSKLKIDNLNNDTISISIVDSNLIYSHISKFKLHSQLDTQNLINRLTPIRLNDSYVRSNFNFNIQMNLAQVRKGDGSLRVFLNVSDKDGNTIPPDLVNIPFLTGANYIDPEQERPIEIVQQENNNRFVISSGPMFGAFNRGGDLKLNFGIGVTLGYRLWEF